MAALGGNGSRGPAEGTARCPAVVGASRGTWAASPRRDGMSTGAVPAAARQHGRRLGPGQAGGRGGTGSQSGARRLRLPRGRQVAFWEPPLPGARPPEGAVDEGRTAAIGPVIRCPRHPRRPQALARAARSESPSCEGRDPVVERSPRLREAVTCPNPHSREAGAAGTGPQQPCCHCAEAGVGGKGRLGSRGAAPLLPVG